MNLPAISQHAFDRARERLNWGEETLERMLERVHWLGLTAGRCCATVRRFLESKVREEGTQNGITYALIHGEVLYIFGRTPTEARSTLVTVYQVPAAIRSQLRAQRRRERQRAHRLHHPGAGQWLTSKTAAPHSEAVAA
jgi:hypothetical protein